MRVSGCLAHECNGSVTGRGPPDPVRARGVKRWGMIAAVEERIQKLLARAGFASRRGAEGLMQEGRVTVNGAVVKELGTKADSAHDDIRVDGVRVKATREPIHIVLNKPRGVVTTRSDPSGRQTVMSLVPDVPGLFPVGRLDLTTEGLIILTNDGAFAERVAHPRFEVPRVYHAKVRGIPDGPTLARIRRGVRVKDEVLAADRVRLVNVDRHAWVEVTLHEGKQHEVRRLLEAVGHPVSKLKRVAFGPVTLRGLLPGQFRALEPGEIKGLLRGEGSRAAPPPRARRRPHPTGPRKSAARKPGERGKGSPPPVARGDAGRGTAGRGSRRADGRKAETGRAEGGQAGSSTGGRAAVTRKAGLGRTRTSPTRPGQAGAGKTGAGAGRVGGRKVGARKSTPRKPGGAVPAARRGVEGSAARGGRKGTRDSRRRR